MTEVCINGHTRTEENTRWHKRGRGEQRKRVCLDCKRENRTDLTGTQRADDRQAQRTTELHENIEDLLRFGATYEEIIARCGFATEKSMRESLRLRNRFDLLEQLTGKQQTITNVALSVPKINGNKYTGSGLSAIRTSRSKRV